MAQLRAAFPLHWAVFVDDLDDLKERLNDPGIRIVSSREIV